MAIFSGSESPAGAGRRAPDRGKNEDCFATGCTIPCCDRFGSPHNTFVCCGLCVCDKQLNDGIKTRFIVARKRYRGLSREPHA